MSSQIPFDLQKALAGGKVVHVSGWEPINLTVMGGRLAYQQGANDTVFNCLLDGTRPSEGSQVLFMAPQKPERKVRYSTVWYDGEGVAHSRQTFESAKYAAHVEVLAITTEKRDGKWYFVSAEVVNA